MVESPLGPAAAIHSGCRNLLGRALSQGNSLEGLSTRAPLSLEDGPGWSGPGIIVWRPRCRGDFLEIELPEVNPAEYLNGRGSGIFVALCLLLRTRTTVALNVEMAGRSDRSTEATPGFVAADAASWQRLAATVRAMDTDRARARLVAFGPGIVHLDGLQYDPRTYAVWQVGEPMRTGLWGRWTPGGTTCGPDTLWAELRPGDVGPSGSLAAWFQPDWPASDFPHVLFDSGEEALGCLFNNGRLIAAAGGSQAWMYLSGDWRAMMRFEPGRWHHAVLTWDASGEVRLYVDGECYARRRSPPALRFEPSRTPSRLFLGCPSRQPGLQGQADMPARLDGLLAAVQLLPVALDDDEAAALHLAGRSRLESLPAERVRVETGPDVRVAESDFYCWFPNKLARMPDGSVELFCASGPDYGLEAPRYWPRDDRRHFRRARLEDPWEEQPAGSAIVRRQPIRLPDGRWLASALVPADDASASARRLWSRFVVSSDGRQWQPFEAELDVPEHENITLAQVTTDSLGRVLLLGSIRLQGVSDRAGSLHEALFGPTRGSTHLYLAESRDSGRSFHLLSLVTEGRRPPFGDFCEENEIVETAPAGGAAGSVGPELLLVGRIRGHQTPCIQMRSLDGGLTWSALELCPFGAVFPRLLRLRNGLILLLTGRPETVVHWTADGGRHWSPPMPLFDSREQPLQSENIWYGPSTGYGSLAEVEPDRVWASYDRLGAYDPSTQKRLNQVRVRELRFRRLGEGPWSFVPASRFRLTGDWRGLGEEVRWTGDADAQAELSFEGTAAALVHPLLRHGGRLGVRIDGRPASDVSCYHALPHHAAARTIVASGLGPGRHTLVLEANLSSAERHAHGDGAELSALLSWLHLAHCGARRWSGFCGLEVAPARP
ncbi:MAG: hypothetical protein HYU36_20855 [Planctomycetes bacterium]|nr:hypothetical protein [Planctomycetota bacterium]